METLENEDKWIQKTSEGRRNFKGREKYEKNLWEERINGKELPLL